MNDLACIIIIITIIYTDLFYINTCLDLICVTTLKKLDKYTTYCSFSVHERRIVVCQGTIHQAQVRPDSNALFAMHMLYVHMLCL